MKIKSFNGHHFDEIKILLAQIDQICENIIESGY